MLGFLYTVYEQVQETEQSILYLKKSIYKDINSAPIIIVSTSKNTHLFSDICDKYNCNLIYFNDAPGDNTRWKSKSNPYGPINPPSKAPSFPLNSEPPGGLWRYNWLAMRILLSIELGVQMARTIGIKGLLHFHSDSYWSEKQENILSDYNKLIENSYMLMVDVAQQQENGVLPKGMRFCPEGIFFNIDECYKYEYAFSFNKIWTNLNSNGNFIDINEFCCQDWCASEALLGQFAYYCLTKKNIFNSDDKLDQVWYNKIYIRQYRNHHGNFYNGFSNLELFQEMKN